MDSHDRRKGSVLQFTVVFGDQCGVDCKLGCGIIVIWLVSRLFIAHFDVVTFDTNSICGGSYWEVWNLRHSYILVIQTLPIQKSVPFSFPINSYEGVKL